MSASTTSFLLFWFPYDPILYFACTVHSSCLWLNYTGHLMWNKAENVMDDQFFSFFFVYLEGIIALEGTTVSVSNYSLKFVGCKYWNLGLLNACVTYYKMLQIGKTSGGCFCFLLLNTSPARSDCSTPWPAVFWIAPRTENLWSPWDLAVMGTFVSGETNCS